MSNAKQTKYFFRIQVQSIINQNATSFLTLFTAHNVDIIFSNIYIYIYLCNTENNSLA